jgi:hypothetical protein
MSVNFPSIQPTACKFTAPQFPVTETQSQSGVRSYRLWGSLASNATLELEFTNISNNSAADIVNCYTNAKGPLIQVVLPAIIFNGLSGTNLEQVLSQANGPWYFVGQSAPTVERVPGRRASVSVQLRAELRIQ